MNEMKTKMNSFDCCIFLLKMEKKRFPMELMVAHSLFIGMIGKTKIRERERKG